MARPGKTIESAAAKDPLDVEKLKAAFLRALTRSVCRSVLTADIKDLYTALAIAVREEIYTRNVAALEKLAPSDTRAIAYLSAEFLPGPHLANNLLSLNLINSARKALAELDLDLDVILEQEEEPGLGNGGLGRLASCYMDSLATLAVPAVGYGIRYEFGIFDQEISGGQQVEVTDKWLSAGNPWEIVRSQIAYNVGFGGFTECVPGGRMRWQPAEEVHGIAYDTIIQGYGTSNCNMLRLWKAEAVNSFDFAAFNHGDYYRAVEQKMLSENITKVLYPNDEHSQGRRLRLQQQYFFVSCSLQDMIRIQIRRGRPLTEFHASWAVQLNDTHPSIAVAELMRLLMDEHGFEWNDAWEVTRQAIAYTNHTLLPEALETWAVPLFQSMLPRHYEIICEINRRFLDDVRRRFPGDNGRVARMSLIDENGERYVRMAHLAAVGSSRINGVAELHSRLLREHVLHDFAEMWPERFCNVTNGVTPRRFLALANPPLAQLITSACGDGWLRDLEQLRKLERFANDAGFQEKWQAAKLAAKQRLARLIAERTGVKVDPASLFDIQVKRVHEYKRQHLNALHILTQYLRLKQNPSADLPSRTFLFAGKAAPGYFMAKLIIRLVNAIAGLVNNDPGVRGRLQVVFFPDFNVKNAQHIYPAANLSEQISTAGKEASGTGNMKFTMNGALTIGTLDGANVEIREEVGAENFFLFGNTVEEVQALHSGGYRPAEAAAGNPELRAVLDLLTNGALGSGDVFRPLADNLMYSDPFLVLADYSSYIKCQERVSALWTDKRAWTAASILNTARAGKFSSDRSIRDYCERIWKTSPLEE